MKIKSQNRNVTFESLYYAIVLLFTDDKKEFEYAYEKAIHDGNGGGCWYLMNRGRCSQHYQRDRKARIKERQKNEQK